MYNIVINVSSSFIWLLYFSIRSAKTEGLEELHSIVMPLPFKHELNYKAPHEVL